MVTGKRLPLPNRCSTAATIRSRTSSPEMPPVVARKPWLPGHSNRARRRPLSSEPKCNTPADLIIGTVDQDLRECCHAMLFAFVGRRKRTDWSGQGCGPFDRRDCQSDRPAEVDGLARTLAQQAAERALLAAPRRRRLSIAQAA